MTRKMLTQSYKVLQDDLPYEQQEPGMEIPVFSFPVRNPDRKHPGHRNYPVVNSRFGKIHSRKFPGLGKLPVSITASKQNSRFEIRRSKKLPARISAKTNKSVFAHQLFCVVTNIKYKKAFNAQK